MIPSEFVGQATAEHVNVVPEHGPVEDDTGEKPAAHSGAREAVSELLTRHDDVVTELPEDEGPAATAPEPDAVRPTHVPFARAICPCCAHAFIAPICTSIA